ncbi:polysaccharide biosynthesis tyrosine autokinase [Kytococcus sedentarius]|uniref:polysaccharide biosynthesis tyrosine autokinase n=1 Tax=Kytococcus sedentarius TaxID=1276 RepID=UPI001950C477|nr:polysaccharide biosynthesis tyrosine autokinase [Kytococcus sedentarius]QRO87115.1 polysaccharide biosynthesis tyrosine autokinase [Kytococcus sedentarius]
MTLDDILRLSRRHIITLVLSTLLGIALAAGWVALQKPVYTATATGVVQANAGTGTVGESLSGNSLAITKSKTYVTYFSSQPVAERVIEELGLDTSPSRLAERVTAKVEEETPNITVSARGDSPERAKQLADAVVAETAEYVRELETQNMSAAPGQPEGEEGQQQDQTPATSILPLANAELPSSPTEPQPARALVLGGLAGLALGYVIAWFRHRQDTRVRTQEDIEEAAGGAPTLGLIPENEALASPERAVRNSDEVDFSTREALRQFRTNLRFVNVDHAPKSIVVTSARMGEGKSTISSNLAYLLAEGGERVILVDADLRRPSVAGIFDIDSSVGLTQVLAGSADLADAVQPTEHPNLMVLPAGTIPPNPSELLGSQRMRDLIATLTQTHRVILDAPPLLPVTDAALLTTSTDGAVLVVAANDTRKEHVERAAANLRNVNARLLGAVINRASVSRLNRILYGEGYGYGSYGYGYGNSYGSDAKGKGKKRRKK